MILFFFHSFPSQSSYYRRHIIDTASAPVRPFPLVCNFCFFTCCAKFCGSQCCRELPVKEIKTFLTRKGISIEGVVEKQELFDSIHNWALDLASQRDFGPDIDLEGLIRLQALSGLGLGLGLGIAAFIFIFSLLLSLN